LLKISVILVERLYENLLIQGNFLTLLEQIVSKDNMIKESHNLGSNNQK